MRIFDTPPYLAPRTPQLDLQADLLNRRIAYRPICAATALEDPKVLDQAWKMVELGEQARVLPSVPVKWSDGNGELSEDERALTPLPAAAEGRGGGAASGGESAHAAAPGERAAGAAGSGEPFPARGARRPAGLGVAAAAAAVPRRRPY
ncbi:hypothetical protein PV408_16285 [Streptomyces sp. ME18-1-4]|nr:hypothetical protein [Streptomyces sp. ME18-1-4]MDX3243335.1 hypothetical protein [Streptomyces sp. ME18-1-4]